MPVVAPHQHLRRVRRSMALTTDLPDRAGISTQLTDPGARAQQRAGSPQARTEDAQ
ncbi:hypothetical protein [Micromonospora sp. LOL_021]|uniref:hypothetical protein n=1 Tax=Micromonospora sp. LOL_021 TaxID=3345417 RepID=UPI003A85CA26